VLRGIENSLQTHPRAVPSLPQEAADDESIDSVSLISPPARRPAGPSIAQQLDDLLSTFTVTDPSDVPLPPRLQQFRYVPTVRPRTPVVPVSLPPRPATVPLVQQYFTAPREQPTDQGSPSIPTGPAPSGTGTQFATRPFYPGPTPVPVIVSFVD
jgi:hypothetical protein